MGKDLQSSRQFDKFMQNDDSQYLCQFTALIVDAVEELAVRISQIEFVCRQRFPDLQTLSQFIQKLIRSRNAGELEWRKKQDTLLEENQKLKLERQHSQEQIKQLVQSLEQTKQKLMDTEQFLSRKEFDKNQLVDKVERLEQNEVIMAELREQLEQKFSEITEIKDCKTKLMEQIELKDQKLIAEQSKRKSLFEEFNKLKANYKELKSQYNFLICKLGDDRRNMPSTERTKDETVTSTKLLNKRCLEDAEENVQLITHVSSKVSKPKSEIAYQKGFDPISPKPPEFAKPSSSVILKQTSSSWRNTRIRQEPGNGDPHDDFLDTPMEIVKNLNRDLQEVDEFAVSDEETQELNAETVTKKNPVPVSGKAEKGFKFVEPVRRKAEREKLMGVECQQCKKFYDAVLPDGGKDDGSMRCEHHDGASRHRYRYAPPSTPEGFCISW